MSKIAKDDPFWEIIDYLNDRHLQGTANLWKTSVGLQYIYWGAYGWDRILYGEPTVWPKTI